MKLSNTSILNYLKSPSKKSPIPKTPQAPRARRNLMPKFTATDANLTPCSTKRFRPIQPTENHTSTRQTLPLTSGSSSAFLPVWASSKDVPYQRHIALPSGSSSSSQEAIPSAQPQAFIKPATFRYTSRPPRSQPPSPQPPSPSSPSWGTRKKQQKTTTTGPKTIWDYH